MATKKPKSAPRKTTKASAKAQSHSRSKAAAKSAAPKKRLHQRAHHHVKRHIMRYVAGGAALFLLTFTAQTGFSYAERKTTTGTSAKNGYMVLYSKKGQYQRAKIEAIGSGFNGGKHRCAGKTFTTQQKETTMSLPVKEKKVVCSAIGGDSQYQITFMGDCKGKQCGHSITVTTDIDGGYCTFVHADARKIRKEAVERGSCRSDAANDNIEKMQPAMRIVPQQKKNKVSGYVELTTPGKSVSRQHCTGQLAVSLVDNNGNTAKIIKAPVKFVGSSLDKKHGSPAYCVAKFNLGAIKQSGNYTITASYPGGELFVPANVNSGTVTVAK